jgi:hypothetical protein
MRKARGAFSALSLRPYVMTIFGALAIWLGLGSALAPLRTLSVYRSAGLAPSGYVKDVREMRRSSMSLRYSPEIR